MRSRSRVGSCATFPHGVSNGRGSSDAVAEMADKQHVKIGEIVFLDGEIICRWRERTGHKCSAGCTSEAVAARSAGDSVRP